MSGISVIMCSRDDARFKVARASYAKALAGVEHEIVRIADARSMCKGYKRGLAQTRGDIIILSHDDVEILADDFAQRLFAHMDRFDVVGVAGTTAPYWFLIIASGALPVWWLQRARQGRRRCRLRDGRCLTCGYDLRATPERCPECGAVPALTK